MAKISCNRKVAIVAEMASNFDPGTWVAEATSSSSAFLLQGKRYNNIKSDVPLVKLIHYLFISKFISKEKLVNIIHK